jgi:hypothetical protein
MTPTEHAHVAEAVDPCEHGTKWLIDDERESFFVDPHGADLLDGEPVAGRGSLVG